LNNAAHYVESKQHGSTLFRSDVYNIIEKRRPKLCIRWYYAAAHIIYYNSITYNLTYKYSWNRWVYIIDSSKQSDQFTYFIGKCVRITRRISFQHFSNILVGTDDFYFVWTSRMNNVIEIFAKPTWYFHRISSYSRRTYRLKFIRFFLCDCIVKLWTFVVIRVSKYALIRFRYLLRGE